MPGRGRPRKHPVEEKKTSPKRGRGRPRKHPVEEKKTSPKRGRGRPRKNNENPSGFFTMSTEAKISKYGDNEDYLERLYRNIKPKQEQYQKAIDKINNKARAEVAKINIRKEPLDKQLQSICDSAVMKDNELCQQSYDDFGM